MQQLPVLAPLDAQIPAWPSNALCARPCPGCDEFNKPLLRRPDELPVAYCPQCSLWYVCHAPTEEALGNFYREYWNAHRAVALDRTAARAIRQQAKLDAPQDPRIVRLGALHALSGRRVLDVGCGTGTTMMKMAACGARPVGVDVSQEVCDFIGERFGFEVHAGTLAKAKLETDGVDAAVMLDLVEHPLDFHSLLEEVCRVVSPGGLILIWTPNGGEAGTSVETACDWVGFRVNLEHMQYFSPRSILNLARKYGLSVEHLETLGTAGLEGLDRPRSRSTVGFLRRWVGTIPGARRLRHRLRAPNPAFSRSGTYCLFTILRLPRCSVPDAACPRREDLEAMGLAEAPSR